MLARKRREYRDYLPQFYDIPPAERTEDETHALRQVWGFSREAGTLLCAADLASAMGRASTAPKMRHCAASWQHVSPGHPWGPCNSCIRWRTAVMLGALSTSTGNRVH